MSISTVFLRPPLRHEFIGQRLAFVPVLDFSAREVAEAMGTTTAAVNSALQRARRLGCYAWEDASGSYVARVLDVLTLRGARSPRSRPVSSTAHNPSTRSGALALASVASLMVARVQAAAS